MGKLAMLYDRYEEPQKVKKENSSSSLGIIGKILIVGGCYSALVSQGITLSSMASAVGASFSAFPVTTAIVGINVFGTANMLLGNDFSKRIEIFDNFNFQHGNTTYKDITAQTIGLAALSTLLTVGSVAGLATLCVMGSTMTPAAVTLGLTGVIASSVMSIKINGEVNKKMFLATKEGQAASTLVGIVGSWN